MSNFVNSNVSSKTFETKYTCNGAEFKFIVNYGLNSIGGQEPYFSITSQLYAKNHLGKWGFVSCGCQHELVRQYAKKLIPLIKWHLCAYESGPMHYEANGIFWWQRAHMTEQVPLYRGDTCAIGTQALEHFKSTVIYGSSKLDTLDFDNMSNMTLDELRVWLRARLPEVMKKFHRMLKSQDLLVPESVVEESA